ETNWMPAPWTFRRAIPFPCPERRTMTGLRTLTNMLAVVAALRSLSAQTPLAHLPPNDPRHSKVPVSRQFHTCPDSGLPSPPHPGGSVYDAELDRRKNRIDAPDEYLKVEPRAIVGLPSPNLKA